MTAASGGEGTLGLIVWPAYIGVVNAELGLPPFALAEPEIGEEYQRGQISWKYRGERIVGRARILCPAGRFTHFVYFQHPTDRAITGVKKMSHVLEFNLARNILDVDPIVNEDLALNVARAPA